MTNVALVIKPEMFSAVYSGSHGCACGCRGNHTSTPRTIKLITGKMIKAVQEGRATEVMVHDSFISVDTDTRVYIGYTDGRVS